MKNDRVKAGTSKSAAIKRREDFARAYIANGRNGTQAAITAGFSPNGADVAAVRMLGDASVVSLIDKLTTEHSARAGLSVERILEEVRRVALSDTRKLYRDDGTLKRPDEWDDDTAAAVAGVDVEEEYAGRGEDRELTGFTKKVKIWDKNAALEKAMKHLGLFERDNTQRADNISIKIVAVG